MAEVPQGFTAYYRILVEQTVPIAEYQVSSEGTKYPGIHYIL